MIIYSVTKAQFLEDVLSNGIGDIIHEAFKASTGHATSINEVRSWQNSLDQMYKVLNDAGIPDDAGIAIEYQIPQTSKRVDMIITGRQASQKDTAILVELKQWDSAGMTEKDGVVVSYVGGAKRELTHPSYQAWTYACLLRDFNEAIERDSIELLPCAYLHNYSSDDVLTNPFYDEYTSKAPVFLKSDLLELREFIKRHITHGDSDDIVKRIDEGRLRPSKSLADELASLLKGNRDFFMIDDQKVAYETALQLTAKSSAAAKDVLIIEGGPGTGKSVLAINLLVELTNRQLLSQYVTRNSAPRKVYEAKLTGSFRKSHISNMFSSSGTFHSTGRNIFDVLLVDEAHRLNAKSGLYSHQGENQIKEIIDASKLSVFFVDEDQKVTLKDIGDKDEIRRWAAATGATVTEMKLESQFRCNGSDGYLAWLDNTIAIHETANTTLDGIAYDFQVFDDPQTLHDVIKEKNKAANKARLVAGYCWKWISKKHPERSDIVIGNYEATWNLDTDGQAWIIKPNSVNEVGCIHTCQGLEVDYVGVIIGPDLLVRDGRIITVPEARASTDKSVHGWKKAMKEDPETTKAQLDAIIKNTYRTLMTRGQKGCYIYCTDEETSEYFKNLRVNATIKV